MDTFEYTILIGAGVIVVGIVVVAGLKALYQRGFEAGQSEGFNFSPEEFQKIYWLAQNGFTRLVLLGERGPGGFQTKQDAEEAHWALERLSAATSPASVISGYARWWPIGSPTRQFLS
jgi:hypothetical protein